jgi:hypothetical protein
MWSRLVQASEWSRDKQRPGSRSRTGTIRSFGGGTIEVPTDFPTIAAALAAASAGDTVLVLPGLYVEAVEVRDGIHLVGRDGPAVTELRGTGTGTTLTVVDSGSGTLVSGLRVTGGLAASGGGIRLRGQRTEIRDSWIEENAAIGPWPDGIGGGILIEADSCLIAGSRIRGNTALAGGGVAAPFRRSVLPPDFVIIDCDVVENEATYFGGGAIVGLGLSLDIERVTLARNSARLSGGGVHGLGLVWLRECTLDRNEVRDGEGSGASGAGLLLRQSIVSNGAGGAGLYTLGSSWVFLVCTDLWNPAGTEILSHGLDSLPIPFHVDPFYCDGPGGNYTLASNSPCLDLGTCGRVGRFDQGCDALSSPGTASAAAPDLIPRTWPNPASGEIHIAVPRSPHTRALEVFDVTGRSVQTIVVGAGVSQLTWRASGQDGRRFPAGVYFVAFEKGEANRTARLVLR